MVILIKLEKSWMSDKYNPDFLGSAFPLKSMGKESKFINGLKRGEDDMNQA
jgi:hypothetical protein